MSKKEVVQLACRAFGLYFAAWALSDLLYMPERIYELLYHLGRQSVLLGEDHFSKYYLLRTTFGIASVFIWLLLAAWFWRGGDEVEKLLIPE